MLGLLGAARPSVETLLTCGWQQTRTATKKAGGTSRNGRDSPGQHLGAKVTHGQAVRAGRILVRQRGMEFYPGENVKSGKDYTLNADAGGRVAFTYDLATRRTHVSVVVPGATTPDSPTKSQALRRLTDALDMRQYIQMGAADRQLHVQDVASDLVAADQRTAAANADAALFARRRPFLLSDLTRV